MDYVEVTIKQVADECGVSKSTAVRKLKELDLPFITRGGKGTVFLGPESASALAHALMKSRIPEVTTEVAAEAIGVREFAPIPEPIASVPDKTAESADTVEAELVIESYRDQIKMLREMNGTLRTQLDQINQTIEAMKLNYESTIAILSSQNDRLHEQIVLIQREKEQIREELALSRALEGFHFPWQRDRIMSQYLLPAGRSDASNESDEPTYETP